MHGVTLKISESVLMYVQHNTLVNFVKIGQFRSYQALKAGSIQDYRHGII